MTENEIKIKLEVLKDWVGNVSLTRQDMQNVIDKAIQALEEIQQYRAIGTVKEIKIREAQFERLSAGYLNDLSLLREYQAIGAVEDLKTMKENGAFTGVELASLACMQLKLKDYLSIGTIEEFKALKEDKNFLEFLYNHIPPNEMEQYLSMYHTKDKIPVNGYADQSGLMSAT